MKLTDEETIDKVNPFEPSRDAHLPGAVRQSGDFLQFRVLERPQQQRQKRQRQWVVMVPLLITMILLLYFLRR